jgi:type IV secretion system protein VirB11
MTSLFVQPPLPPIAPIFDQTKPIRSLLQKTGIQDLLNIAGTSEVAINRPGEIWNEENGRWRRHDAPHLTFDMCKELAILLSVTVNNDKAQLQKTPICPVLLPDGQRGQIVMPPVTERGCISFTIRQPSDVRFTLDDYHESGRLSGYKVIEKKGDIEDWEKEMVMCIKRDDMRKFFKMAIFHKLNLLFGGKTGSGKTTFSKAYVDLYPSALRYGTIEDIHELSMPFHPNRVHLFYGPHLPARKCVESCMRMKYDHIFMSELKGDETWSYFSLLNTGHEGSVTTAHFNNCRSAPGRLAELVMQSEAGSKLSYDFVHRTVKTTIDGVFMWKGSYLTEVLYNPEEKLRLLNGE